jgi:UDP-3-O-[3-hydroxymyristoyl] glucosamine N-acyltransferase
MQKSLRELAELVGGELNGNPDAQILGAADIADAEEGDIVFAETPKLFEEARRSKASAIIACPGARDSGKAVITVENPRFAFAKVLRAFTPAKERRIGVDPSSIISPDAVIGENPSVGANVHVGKQSAIGKNAFIYPFVYVGENVRIGDDCVLYPFVTILDDVSLGDRVIVHSGTVIGSDGFGFTKVGGEHYKMPQIGSVTIGDDVEIGANVTIDKARTGKTEIGRGTKIDNLVHIAHNVKIGENCILVAQTGISGSVQIGDRVILAGQSGVKDHLTVGDDAIVCARAGVIGSIGAGEFVSGFPARDHKEQLRIQAAQQRVPGLLRTVKDLEKRIKELEDRAK